jgi:hypothetical protein
MIMNEKINIVIDSEWSSQDELLSVQANVQNIGIFYFIPEAVHHRLKQKNIEMSRRADVNCMIIPSGNLVYELLYKSLSTLRPTLFTKNISVNLDFYFSIRDVMYFFDQEIVTSMIDKGFITQKNNIRGSFTLPYEDIEVKYTLRDRSGWVRKGGLKALLNTLGVKHNTKDSLAEYKMAMEKTLENQETYDIFVEYGLEDVISLSKVPTLMVSFMNEISTDIMGIPKELEFTVENIPSTIGSVGARFFQNFLLKEITSTLDCDFTEGMERIEQVREHQSINRNILNGKSFDSKNKRGKSRKNRSECVSDFLNACSVKSIGYLHNHSTGILNTLVQGGRTYNEKHWEYLADDVLDLDLSSCYASGMRTLTYPIGIPTIEAFTTPELCPTLSEFLKDNEDELLDNLYTLTISGNLNFDQTLLYSKITNTSKYSIFESNWCFNAPAY